MNRTETHPGQQPQTPASARFLRLLAPLLPAALLALALLFPAVTHAAPPADEPAAAQQDDVLSGVDKFAQGAKESNEVTLDKNMMGMASTMMLMQGGNHAGMDLALMGMMQKMDSVLVRDYEYASAGQYNMNDVEQIRKRLDTGGWSHLVKTRSATETSDICVRTDAEGVISDLVIIDAEPKELSFIHLKGHMSPKDLSKMSGSFGGPGDLTLKQRPK
jgi:hypothetical protein